MELSKVLQTLKTFAPLRLAESWDNVGLLVEPVTKRRPIDKILLTIDLTERVVDEAAQHSIPLIIAYHPPIFAALKKLTAGATKERIAVKAIEHGIAIYSPHTSYDSVQGGINDWLASGLGEASAISVLQPHTFHHDGDSQTSSGTHRASVYGLAGQLAELRTAIASILGSESSFATFSSNDSASRSKLEFKCQQSHLGSLAALLAKHAGNGVTWETHSLEKLPQPGTGQGRLVTLAQPTPLPQLLTKIKAHLQVEHVRIALPSAAVPAAQVPPKTQAAALEHAKNVLVQKIALCAGSGSSVMRGVRADVYLTGEMGHHDVLDAVSSGAAVVLCEHTNTERGYLAKLRESLAELFGTAGVQVTVSQQDADPLVIV
ncbi:NIF3-like protein 1 [Capsaspora owczarzaki ATCC 30864]|uniref:NIF3-like protein 1 n=1 Tax=Capsaspora owczarzaki (strain ATCC 30864) TaxID=595528 RepID=A0A0D2WU71_CAPO3|nr:NIF3-like protein 1 [Capsaspora owczarzaki ATCC 30864]KJE95413.1 NIF3-like protein 1 [Capsaspora owczarzaki ATCC 30864]|eukprot:XP_004345457.1 NIF3-like protein 1 [Capsaspora owczarzaki ATCC 30864]